MFWNLYARLYGLVEGLVPYQEMMKAVVSKIEPHHLCKVLDAGCGRGYLVTELERQDKNVEYRGIDSSETMLSSAHKRSPSHRFTNANLAEALDFPDQSLDYIVSVNVLYTLPNPKQSIDNWRRLLKPHGKMIICTPKRGGNFVTVFQDHLRKSGWFSILPVFFPLLLLGAMNCIIHKKEQASNFHFLTQEQLGELIKIDTIESIYADQDWLVVGQ